jgi:hypothetical protein
MSSLPCWLTESSFANAFIPTPRVREAPGVCTSGSQLNVVITLSSALGYPS